MLTNIMSKIPLSVRLLKEAQMLLSPHDIPQSCACGSLVLCLTELTVELILTVENSERVYSFTTLIHF